MMMKGNTVDDYLNIQPEPVRTMLENIRTIIRKEAPDAGELISYQMPAYKYYGMLAYFAAAKNHIGIYFMPPVIQAFKEKLKDYVLTKSAIRVPFDQPIPPELLSEMVRYAVQENLAKKILKEEKRKNRKK